MPFRDTPRGQTHHAKDSCSDGKGHSMTDQCPDFLNMPEAEMEKYCVLHMPDEDQFIEEAVKQHMEIYGDESELFIRGLLHRHAEYVKERCIAAVPEKIEEIEDDIGFGFNLCIEQVIDNIKKV